MPSSKPVAPGARWCQPSPWTEARVIVPPANQGRRSCAQRLPAGDQRADCPSGSRTSCRRTAARSPADRRQVEAVGRARTRRSRAARPSRARAPRRSTPADAARRRSWTAPGRRTAWSAAGRAPRARAEHLRPRRAAGRARAPACTSTLAPLRARELADAVDRVVVVVGEQEAAAGRERIGLADELERAAGVGREDDLVLVSDRRGSSASTARAPPRASSCEAQRGRVLRVRVAEHALAAAARGGGGSATPRRARRRCSRGRSAPGGRGARSRWRAARRPPRSPRTRGTAARSRRGRRPAHLRRSERSGHAPPQSAGSATAAAARAPRRRGRR